MDTLLAQVAGTILMVASAAGTTATLYGRTRRGPGRVALSWLALGTTGLTTLGTGIAPHASWAIVAGAVVTGGLLACAIVLGALRMQDLKAARRRDALLGVPPVAPMPAARLIVSLSALAALLICTGLFVPGALAFATAAGMPPAQLAPGLIADILIAIPVVWVAIGLTAWDRYVQRARDTEALCQGIETRVADSEAAAYRDGFAAGREEGYHHAAFGTSWE
jgi:uncharacterized membrane protein YidH (DUF202 family)